MTLALIIVNDDQAMIVTDMRITDNGRLVKDESIKTGLIQFTDAKLLWGYTGLALWGDVWTKQWFKDFWYSVEVPTTIDDGIDQFVAAATLRFSQSDVLNLDPSRRKLTFCFVGYRAVSPTESMAESIAVSNYHDFHSGIKSAEPSLQFQKYTWNPWMPLPNTPVMSCAYAIGASVNDEILGELTMLVDARAPIDGIKRKCEKIICDVAAKNPTVGRNLLFARMDPSLHSPPYSEFSAASKGNNIWSIDRIDVSRSFKFQISNFHLRSSSIVKGRIPSNAPCYCGRRKKYKNCHGSRK